MAPGAKQRRRAREKRAAEEAAARVAPGGGGGGASDGIVVGEGDEPPLEDTLGIPPMPAPRKKRKTDRGGQAADEEVAAKATAGGRDAGGLFVGGGDEPPLEDTQNIPPIPEKKKADKGWKAVQIDMDLMKEFDVDGGVFLEEADDDIGISYSDGTKEMVGSISSKKAKKKQKGSKTEEAEAAVEAAPGANADVKAETADTASAELTAWTQFDLHPELLRGIGRLGFRSPTEVQRRCLAPAIRQRKDIVGAAETGSGKTLAFGLPILHHTLMTLDQDSLDQGSVEDRRKAASQREGGPRALVILPTRELAVQVGNHINAAANHTVVRAECVVGGISVQKQMRLLRRKPYIVVGTPGRLHALLGVGKNAKAEERCDWFRNGASDLRHLVLDEADRLVESGHFRELDGILAHVYSVVQRAQQLQTFVFSATLTLDPRSNYQKAKQGDDGGKVGALMRRMRFREARAVHTVDLTQPEETRGGASSSAAGAAPVEGSEEAAAAAAAAAATALAGRQSRLPERLQLMEATCSDDKDKEAVLAMYLLRRYRWSAPTGPASTLLAASEQQAAAAALAGAVGGRVVLFVNAITSALRLTSVLSLLLESPSATRVLDRVRLGSRKQESPGLSVDVLGLHSRMRQKDRMKRMERFRSLKHAVLVCTDIAARGLDVPEVAAVIHYQAPRGAEVFVHRSGRTARAGRSGESVAFMGPSDAKQWNQVYRTTGVSKDSLVAVDITANELNAARETVRLAADLEGKVHREHRRSGDRTWLKRTADEAELALSEDENDGERGKAPAARRQLWGLYQQLQARTRRPPRRSGGGPQPKRKRGRR